MLRLGGSHLLSSRLVGCLVIDRRGSQGLALSGDLCKLRKRRLFRERPPTITTITFPDGNREGRWKRGEKWFVSFFGFDPGEGDGDKCPYCDHFCALIAPGLPLLRIQLLYCIISIARGKGEWGLNIVPALWWMALRLREKHWESIEALNFICGVDQNSKRSTSYVQHVAWLSYFCH